MQATAPATPPVVAHLRPGFTAIANAIVDMGLLTILKPTEVNLMLVIGRFSTGFLRFQAIIGEQQLMIATGASRTALYEAKASLVERGLITVTHTKTGICCYELCNMLQPLRTKSEQVPATSKALKAVRPTPSAPPEGDPSAQADPYKEFKEIQDQQHPVPVAPLSNDADSSDSFRSQGPWVDGSLRTGLVARLQGLGVDEFMAHRLVKTSSAEIVTRAIDRLKTVSVTNPAGYLVSEITRGGYRDRVDPNKAQREFHREVHEKRLAERLRETQQAQKSQEQADLLLAQFAALPTELQLDVRAKVQDQAEREGFTRMRGWSEAHPVWRGLLAELLRQNAASDKHSCAQGQDDFALELATKPG